MVETSPGARKGEISQNKSKRTLTSASTSQKGTATRNTDPLDDILRIAVLGPQGCGKSSLINAAHERKVCEVSDGYSPSTTEFHSANALRSGEHKFILIDSPGFDNGLIGDGEIFTKFVEHLCRGNTPSRLAGVIYIHPEGASLGSGTLRRNLGILKAILGPDGVKRITVVLVPHSQGRDQTQLTGPLLHRKSPFAELCALGAQITASMLETQPVRNILLRYCNLGSQLVADYRERPTGQIKKLGRLIEDYLQPKDGPPTESRATKKSSRSQLDLEQAAAELNQLKAEVVQSNSRADDLNAQLQQTRAEYASLRSHLQIHDNSEQSQLVQDLIDLNRRIADFGHSVSQHLIDTYADASHTSRHAFNLAELEKMFTPVGGGSSLVQSSTGVGMPLEDFFDLAARSLVCEQLCKGIFQPFHPAMSASDPANKYISGLYAKIREQEPQPSAGRWRTYAFDALSRKAGGAEMSRLESQLLHKILNSSLLPLLKHFFPPGKEAQLTPQHIESLRELTKQAWEWNILIRGKIILLGDFHPTVYPYGTNFDTQTMLEFEPERGNSKPTRILSTIGIGMVAYVALGAGEAPKRTILHRACIVSERRLVKT